MAQTTLFSREQIDRRVAEMAKEISAEFAGTELIALCVLKGAMFFCADLVRQMDMDVALDFIQISSYGNQKYSSGVVTILKEPQLDMRGKSVLIVEDIIDSGLTLAYLRKNLLARNPASVEVCALLVREGLQKLDPDLRYVGFRIPPAFVVGYGLDAREEFRNLPFVAEYLEDQP